MGRVVRLCGFMAVGAAKLAHAAETLDSPGEPATPDPLRARGQALYEGRLPFMAGEGRGAVLRGHEQALPAAAVRCMNCHEAEPGPNGAGAGRLGTRLDRDTLTQPLSRRGGPASRYTPATWCLTLRTGVDPAQVVLQQIMPRFELSDTDCQALWLYLSQRAPSP